MQSKNRARLQVARLKTPKFGLCACSKLKYSWYKIAFSAKLNQIRRHGSQINQGYSQHYEIYILPKIEPRREIELPSSNEYLCFETDNC